MGIKGFVKLVSQFVKHVPIRITDLTNKNVAFDANLFFYKTVLALRTNIPITNKHHNLLHVIGVTNRLITLKILEIRAIFVFDSSFSKIKQNTIDSRKLTREKTAEHLKIRTSDYDDFLTILQCFGFPVIFATEEADSECAALSSTGLVDYVVSDDPDILLFGAKNIIKNFTTNIAKDMSILTMSDILEGLNMSREELVNLSILLGTDYAPTVQGIGPAKALNIIRQHSTIKNAQDNNIITSNYAYDDVVHYFLHPKQKKIHRSDLVEFAIDYNAFIAFAKNKKCIDNEVIRKICDKIYKIYIDETS